MRNLLVVVSATKTLPLKDGTQHPTGHFLGELAVPVQALLEHGYKLTFASPGGVAPAIDQDSLSDLYWIGDDEGRRSALALVASLPGLKQPEVLENLDLAQLGRFAGVFVPGGHAPMIDLAHHPVMGHILSYFHQQDRPIGLICHAPTTLMATAAIKPWPFKGYKLTVFGQLEEKIAETFFLHGNVPFYPSKVLAEQGATVDNALLPSVPHVVVDRELVTGQNPYSAHAFAEAFLEALASREASVDRAMPRPAASAEASALEA